MLNPIGKSKDFWAGLIYVFAGSVAFFIAQTYTLGTAQRMGPAYFPSVLAGLLVLIGLVSLLRSVSFPRNDAELPAWKPTALIVGACALFAFLLPRAGLPVALAALVLVSSSASPHFRLEGKSIIYFALITIFCAVVFVYGLKLPMPLLGRWFAAS